MFWKLEEARLVQQRIATSAVDGLTVGTAVVPEGKCWVITACGLVPDVAETRVVSFDKIARSGDLFSILNPISLALNPMRATFIEQGMEYILFPGEQLLGRRSAATAGSTFSILIQFVEIDLPLYTYDEPQIVKRQKSALSTIRQRLGGGSGRASMIGSQGRGSEGGGGSTRGGALPV